MDFYEFYMGKEFEAYRFLGAHPAQEGTVFRTFAPSAERISVIGSFNDWQETPMHRIHDGNFWECTIPEAKPGMMYKYKIYKSGGWNMDHCDPYGFQMELRPNAASLICDMDTFEFQDSDWMQIRNDRKDKALNIYEIHAGSWKRKAVKETVENAGPESWYNYEELGELLVPYLKENGYDYVELMPLSEHPCDESWGYQNTGFFAPTSRYGTPDQLRTFVQMCHDAQIGVIMDFVPVHFALDPYALINYDGTALYEYPHTDVGVSEWGSCNFMHSRGEVRSFLQSAAYYWLKEYHFDGLRMDAVSNLIYWQGDAARGENKMAIQFLQTMNQGLKTRMSSALLIAEDSSSYSGVTRSVPEGGLGFDYKWDMGWMNDTLDYFRTAPEYRSENYHKLTFSMHYYYNERYLLPLSHDEVVHGKATIIQKMSGDYEQKFSQIRAFYMYMYAHPGKKLNFMGNEIGQFREWDEKREQDWDLLKYPKHDEFHRFMINLNQFYLKHPEFWKEDYAQNGFAWLDCHQEERCIYAFVRCADTKKILAVFNFSDQLQEGYELKISEDQNKKQKLKLVFSSSDLEQQQAHPAYEKDVLVKKGMAVFDLPAFSARYYEIK